MVYYRDFVCCKDFSYICESLTAFFLIYDNINKCCELFKLALLIVYRL